MCGRRSRAQHVRPTTSIKEQFRAGRVVLEIERSSSTNETKFASQFLPVTSILNVGDIRAVAGQTHNSVV